VDGVRWKSLAAASRRASGRARRSSPWAEADWPTWLAVRSDITCRKQATPDLPYKGISELGALRCSLASWSRRGVGGTHTHTHNKDLL